jgi:hypothetical protein
MCQINEQTVLSGYHNTQVNWCACCCKYSLYYKNVCFGFSHTEFHAFGQVLSRLQSIHFHYYLCNEPQVLLKNQNESSGVFLNEAEVAEIIHLINEASLMHEVYSILER